MSTFITANDSNFKSEVLDYADTPVLVKFSAPWCGPCKVMAPIAEQVASARDDSELRFVEVNVDDAIEVTSSLGIRGVPTVMIFNEGQKVATAQGSLNRSDLEAFIDQHI